MGCLPDKNIKYDMFIAQPGGVGSEQMDEQGAYKVKIGSPKKRTMDRAQRLPVQGQPRSPLFNPIQKVTPGKNLFMARRASESHIKHCENVEKEGGIIKRPSRSSYRQSGIQITLPSRQHVITAIETPSESFRTSILGDLQNNPSTFFQLGQADLDKIFKETGVIMSEQLIKKVSIIENKVCLEDGDDAASIAQGTNDSPQS